MPSASAGRYVADIFRTGVRTAAAGVALDDIGEASQLASLRSELQMQTVLACVSSMRSKLDDANRVTLGIKPETRGRTPQQLHSHGS